MTEIYPITNKIRDTWAIISYDDSFTVGIREWIIENVKNDWAVDGWSGVAFCTLYFEDEGDAVAFKLRWI